jgi:hypothetical protein
LRLCDVIRGRSWYLWGGGGSPGEGGARGFELRAQVLVRSLQVQIIEVGRFLADDSLSILSGQQMFRAE